jgi:putative Mn2+ efflux pump MntP
MQQGTGRMFTLSGLLLVSLALGMSNFAVAIGIGLGGVEASTRVRMALVFGFFEALMPIIGLLVGQGVAGLLGEIGRYVGAGLLIITGAFTLWKARTASRETGDQQEENQHAQFGRLVVTGFAISIDNLVVGFALSFSHVPFLLAAGVIAVVSVAMSLVGLELGKHLGKRFEQWSEELSGCIIILVGIAIGIGFF